MVIVKYLGKLSLCIIYAHLYVFSVNKFITCLEVVFNWSCDFITSLLWHLTNSPLVSCNVIYVNGVFSII